MAGRETNAARKTELEEISRICRRVPRHGARNFRQALQSAFFAQVALNPESLDNAVSPGRMDQYLYPFYKADIERGVITREKAKELLSCFSIKMSETIPVFSGHLTNFHCGMQVQINVLDPAVMLEARDNPHKYPDLLVRVSGYSAYFNDLAPAVKDKIIRRSCIAVDD